MEEIPKKKTRSSINKTISGEIHSEYEFICHICGIQFDRMFFLTNHTKEAHSCLPRVKCICGKYIATWPSLMKHRQKHSKEEALFECACGSKFLNQIGLSIHMALKHKDNEGNVDVEKLEKSKKQGKMDRQNCKCEYCDKILCDKRSLAFHIDAVHNQLKNFECHICTKKFATQTNLRSHLISHSTENVKCQICNQTFKNRVSLQSHKKYHNEKSRKYQCKECDKRFFAWTHLIRHEATHSTERNFKCDLCDKSYKHVSNSKV